MKKHKKGGFLPRWESTYREGIASIASVLRQEGHTVSLLKLSSGVEGSILKDLWSQHFKSYDIAAFTVNTVDVPEVFRLSSIIKQHAQNVITICGGVHPTLSPEHMMTDPSIDIVCRGEGEYIMSELCNHLSAHQNIFNIAGLWVRDGDSIHKNDLRPLIEDLSALLPPARDLPVYSDYDQKQVKDKTFFMGTRGCPYTCTYCCNKSLSKIYPNPEAYYRFKPVDMIIGEIKDYLSLNPSELWIALYDDVMMGKKDWFNEFCSRYKKEINKSTFLTGRWELLNQSTIPLLKKISCRYLLVGVEVGDEQLRLEILSRKQSDKLMLERTAMLRQYKIMYGLYTMVGIPQETLSKALKTVKLSARITSNPFIGHHTIFYPFEGTPLYKVCEQRNILSERWVDSYFTDSLLDMDYFPRKQIVWAHKNFKKYCILYWLIFRLPGFVSTMLENKLDNYWNQTAQK